MFNSAPDYLLYNEIKDDIKTVRDEETGEISDVLELWLQPTLFDGSNAKQSLGIVDRYYVSYLMRCMNIARGFKHANVAYELYNLIYRTEKKELIQIVSNEQVWQWREIFDEAFEGFEINRNSIFHRNLIVKPKKAPNCNDKSAHSKSIGLFTVICIV